MACTLDRRGLALARLLSAFACSKVRIGPIGQIATVDLPVTDPSPTTRACMSGGTLACEATRNHHRRRRRGLYIAISTLGLFLAGIGASPTTNAKTFTVNSTVDAVDANPGDGTCETASGNGVCTLRAAIQETNALAGPNEIILPSGTYTLTIPGRFEGFGIYRSAIGQLDITNDLTINGAGASTTIIDGNGLDRVFHVDPVPTGITVTITGVTVQNGVTAVIPFVSADGGGILLGATFTIGCCPPSGTLTLIDSVVKNNATPRDGGGIANKAGRLTLIRTSVTGNSAGNGGGIANGDLGVVNVTDSTISGNFANAGGGIFSGFFDISNGTKVILTNSTISGNHSFGFGGGIYQNRGPVALMNVTVSGNSAAASGGGIFTGPGFANVSLNSSTITNNTTGEFGGGIAESSFAATNSIIAGNFGGNPDCSGTIISGGYNLIGSIVGCGIAGTTTGNVIGLDPKLGLLADNGGPAPTHALIAGSPAIDAGSPATVGTGGNACPISDERGYLRPRGAGCDIGAFERVTEFSVSGILPNRGANAAPVIAFVSGNGFAPGATVILRRSGQTDIVGSPANVEQGGSEIATVFDLSAKSPGLWDLVVANSDGTTASRSGAFNVDQQNLPSDLWLRVIGPSRIGPGRIGTLTMLFGNRGNSDAFAVPLSLAIPNTLTGSLLFIPTPPPAQPGQVPTDWTQVPIGAATDSAGYFNFNLLIPIIPANYTGALEFQLRPSLSQEGMTVSLLATFGLPYFSPSLDPAVVSQFTTGAQAYAQQNLGVTIPSTLVPQMNQYISDDLQSLVQEGRNALIASFGTQTQTYSLGQISFDLARFGAAAANAQNSSGVAQQTNPSRPRHGRGK